MHEGANARHSKGVSAEGIKLKRAMPCCSMHRSCNTAAHAGTKAAVAAVAAAAKSKHRKI
jgi:hypothetical protein